MSRQLNIIILLILQNLHLSVLAESKPSIEANFKNFTLRILKTADSIRQSKESSATRIKKMDLAADELSKDWDKLMSSSDNKNTSFKDPQSATSQAFMAYTHFILLTKMKAQGSRPPTPEDCKEKKLQMEFDYPTPEKGAVEFSSIDKNLDLLRKSLCHE